MGALFVKYDSPPVRGRDITMGKHLPEVFVTEKDEVLCFAGVCLKDDTRPQSLFMNPYYFDGKHSTDKDIADTIAAFYRITDGCIVREKYVDNGYYSNRLLKRINCIIKFPSAYSEYAVLVNDTEDEKLTRKIFGLTQGELIQLLDAYAKVMGTGDEYSKLPRLTRNTRISNYCEVTDVWIPEQFPYVAFAERGCDFSHVSLYGLYRHIQLLTGYDINSVFARALIRSGASETTLDRVLGIDLCNSYYSIIKKTPPHFD